MKTQITVIKIIIKLALTYLLFTGKEI